MWGLRVACEASDGLRDTFISGQLGFTININILGVSVLFCEGSLDKKPFSVVVFAQFI